MNHPQPVHLREFTSIKLKSFWSCGAADRILHFHSLLDVGLHLFITTTEKWMTGSELKKQLALYPIL